MIKNPVISHQAPSLNVSFQSPGGAHIKYVFSSLCMAIEDEKATLVQQRWRAKMNNRDYWLRYRSAAKLQAVTRGRLARRDHLPDHKAPTPNGQFFTRTLHLLRPAATRSPRRLHLRHD